MNLLAAWKVTDEAGHTIGAGIERLKLDTEAAALAGARPPAAAVAKAIETALLAYIARLPKAPKS